MRWVWLAIALLLGFLLYAACQERSPTGGIAVTVTPVPVVREVVPVQAQPVLATPIPDGGLQNRYYVFNDLRLYCSLITNDLQYIGEPAMQAWWDMLQPELKQW